MNQHSSTALSKVPEVTLLFWAIKIAGTAKQESTGEYVDDAVITTTVKAVILNEKFMTELPLNVETFKGTVQLSGFVKTAADRDKAVILARSVKGVTQVKDDIIIR